MVAYLLLLFLGEFGVHRYYLSGKYIGAGLIQLILGVTGWLTVWVLVGFLPLFVAYVWNCVDLVLLPGIANEAADKLRESYAEKIVLERKAPTE